MAQIAGRRKFGLILTRTRVIFFSLSLISYGVSLFLPAYVVGLFPQPGIALLLGGWLFGGPIWFANVLMLVAWVELLSSDEPIVALPSIALALGLLLLGGGLDNYRIGALFWYASFVLAIVGAITAGNESRLFAQRRKASLDGLHE